VPVTLGDITRSTSICMYCISHLISFTLWAVSIVCVNRYNYETWGSYFYCTLQHGSGQGP
jgi:hypothetical protein